MQWDDNIPLINIPGVIGDADDDDVASLWLGGPTMSNWMGASNTKLDCCGVEGGVAGCDVSGCALLLEAIKHRT